MGQKKVQTKAAPVCIAVVAAVLPAVVAPFIIDFMNKDRGRIFSLYQFKQRREKLALPRVGERVMSKQFGKIWKEIEEKEIWLKTPLSNDSLRKIDIIPAIYIRYWCEETNHGAGGVGKTLTYQYSASNTSFKEAWKILYE